MKLKLKYFLIVLPILIGASLFLGVKLSNASCSASEISQLMKESENCDSLSCYTSILNRLETCKTEVQQKKEEAAQETAALQQKVNELSSSISQKSASIASLNAQIADLQYKISKLNKEIIETEKRMAKNKERIKVAIKNFYEYDHENLITIVLSEGNISNFFDEVFYVGKIEKEISSIVEDLKESKKNLQAKKKEIASSKELLEISRNKLSSEMTVLAQEKAEKSRLLGSAQGELAEYAELLETIKKEKSDADRELRRLLEQSMRNSRDIISGGSGGYPYAGQCDQVDPWKFLTCQCTSYAAWRWNSWGYNWYNTQPGHGSAKYWPQIAHTLGYPTGSLPRVRAIISWPWGTYGHVAIVENVFSDGSIRISEYNNIPKSYSARTISPGDYAGATFIYPK